jgi:hypothetical protein
MEFDEKLKCFCQIYSNSEQTTKEINGDDDDDTNDDDDSYDSNE